ncbi:MULTISPECIES: hypothetical protein [unclassified Curtobacterium]|uniref:hypothetical protein n=1 Tax=unclassified Curtobacterium TaxID=257496 RepID=UPI000D829CC8|nr:MULTISPECIES: hypothetical protein [unclassified Curtobacterium]PYY33960.1 hypothetical protein DEI89_09230 [Curtobacterium sp. MCBD17_030]PZE35700.1 hypothetical protein DEJ31_11095 [Curtobacterium sp. MCPF17_031]
MTILGAVLIGSALLGVLLRRRALVAVALGCAAGLPSSAGLVVGQPVPIFVCVGAVAGVAFLVEPRRAGPTPVLTVLVGFAVWSLTWTVMAPWVFAGVPVLTPRGGVERQLSALTPLGYTTTNFAQSLILASALGAAAFLIRSRTAPLALTVTTWVGVGGSLVRSALRQAGLDVLAPFLDTLQTYYADTDSRWRGVFNEPSELAAFATGVAAYATARALLADRSATRVACSALAVGAGTLLLGSASGTALVTTGIVAGTALIVLVARFAANGGRGAPWVVLGLLAVLITAMTMGTDLIEPAVELATGKLGSQSQLARSGADGVGLEVFWDTGGLGAGLGGNRASSFVVTLLSTVGVVGTALFSFAVFRTVRTGLRSRVTVPAAVGLLALLVAKTVAIPDLGTPLLWILLCASLSAGASKNRRTSGDGSAASAHPSPPLRDDVPPFHRSAQQGSPT